MIMEIKVKMLPFLLVVLLPLVFCTTGHNKDNISFCVHDGKAAECQQQNVDYNITDLSELEAHLSNYSNVALLLFLTGGDYPLTTNLHFRNKEVRIQTALNTEMGNIHCTDNSNITFDEQKYLLINQLSLHKCNINITSVKNWMELSINISGNVFQNGLIKITFSSEGNNVTLNIHNCTFRNECAIIYDDVYNSQWISEINIINSSFSGTEKKCGYLESAVTFDMENMNIFIKNSNFVNNTNGALTTRTCGSMHMIIDNCSICSNSETALSIKKIYETFSSSIVIHKSKFVSNAKALLIEDIHNISINHSIFMGNYVTTAKVQNYVVKIIGSRVSIANSNFSKNYNHREKVECSSIYILYAQKALLDNLTITDNNCTGITLENSNATINNSVNLERNFGHKGALQILSSELHMLLHSQLNVINNRARSYGGGIFTDKKCDRGENEAESYCCLYIPAIQNSSKLFNFAGNLAQWGGNVIYGGCSVCCFAEIKGKEASINATNFLNFITATSKLNSSSNAACEPTSVVFCTSDFNYTYHMNITIFSGQDFNVPLVAVDNNSSPSAQFIVARTQHEQIIISPELYFAQNIPCSNYSYSIGDVSDMAKNFIEIEYSLQNEINKHNTLKSAKLTLFLKECPIGFHLEKGSCKCIKYSSYFPNVKCIQEHYKLEVPELTWIGRKNGTDMHMVAKHCLYCLLEPFESVLNDSDKLCSPGRGGVVCGKCAKNQSLLLSGDRCGDCRGSTLQGAMLTILLAIIAILLIIMLLTLNLTVSTGMINALVFYSNVVYIHHTDFLPPLSNDNSTKNNLARFLSAFPAWISLDFRISVCFYENYNTYIHTWSQFAYPIYIWLLILLIVCASRYSRRLAKLTALNIVPVLATLLLLSYTKLLAVSINVFSYTELYHINGTMYANSKVKVWKLDGSIDYAKNEHLPLFLMSILMTVAYIIPFTLLVLLGPLLQAKSHHRLLSWINKLKPLMDAFYGPYSNKYRYWPGILLLARVVLFITFAVTDGTIALATITSVVIILLILWFILGRNISISPYQKTCYLNYLEFFFLFNLGTFSIATEAIHRFNKTRNLQPALAVTMAGSAFTIFCGLMAYQTAQAMLKFKVVQGMYKLTTTHKFTQKIRVLILRQKATTSTATQETSRQWSTEESCTHSTVAMAECTQSVELREPLLTTSLNL